MTYVRLQRLVESAEQAAVSAPRDGSVAPKYYASQRFDVSSVDGKILGTGQEGFLSSNRHFDHLAVNVTLSAVLLPAGVREVGKLCIRKSQKNQKKILDFFES